MTYIGQTPDEDCTEIDDTAPTTPMPRAQVKAALKRCNTDKLSREEILALLAEEHGE